VASHLGGEAPDALLSRAFDKKVERGVKGLNGHPNCNGQSRMRSGWDQRWG